jgi:hypothetical protein
MAVTITNPGPQSNLTNTAVSLQISRLSLQVERLPTQKADFRRVSA